MLARLVGKGRTFELAVFIARSIGNPESSAPPSADSIVYNRIIRIPIISEEGEGKRQCMDITKKLRMFSWRIENFSSISYDLLLSSFYLRWQQMMFLLLAVNRHTFTADKIGCGFPSFLPLSELYNPKRGYLVNDSCLVEAFVSTDRNKSLISRALILNTVSFKHKTNEVECVKAALRNQKPTRTKPVEITTASSTQPSCQNVAIEPEEPTEEDMNTFFTSLESELLSSDIVYSREEAKGALATLDEALSMTPVNSHDSGKSFPLKQAFKILASFDCSSTTLPIEQRNELLSMEESKKELADRAAKAVQDKNHFTAKESIKNHLTRKLDRNLIRYKEVESEVKQVQQKLAALLAEQKGGIFRGSKEMKKELEAIGNEWEEYKPKPRLPRRKRRSSSRNGEE
ncbi:hypothetical protein V6N13_038101 [Hibiscus sabdariffa]